MKRLTVLLLALLLLCGCGAEPVPTTEPATVAAEPTEPTPGLYEPNSPVEEETAGAVRTYIPEITGFPEIAFMGTKMLLLEEDSNLNRTRISVLEGENRGLGNSVVIEACVSLNDPSLWIGSRELAYYDEAGHRVVWLDENLAETRQLKLPEGAATPMLSSDLRTVYYCLGNEIHVLEVDRGITRLLKQHTCIFQTLNGIHMHDKVLEVYVSDGSPTGKVVFVSTETGETLGEDPYTREVQSLGDEYMILRNDGFVDEVLLGAGEEKLRSLELGSDYPALTALLSMGAVAVCEGTELTLYDIQTGLKIASVSFQEAGSVYCLTPDPDREAVWMLRNDLQTGMTSLYRWDTAMTPVEDDTLYIHSRYTADDPDLEGLARCEEQAKALSETYGVQILMQKDLPAPFDCSFTYEYHVPACEQALETLENALARFPEGFLLGLGQVSDSGVLTIGLIRSLEGTVENAIDDAAGLQYYLEGNAYIALVVGDKLEQNLYHKLMHVLETYVLNNSDAYDEWDDLNPKKFEYFGNYTEYLSVDQDDGWLQGKNRAFVDAYAMCSAKEDRARILEYALMEGQEEIFESDTMQKKLRQLCIGIRKAYGWDQESTAYPWEQYLEKPLAKIK